MKKRKRKPTRRESFVNQLSNTLSTILLAVVILLGMKVYSASVGNNLKFAHVSDVHFSTIKYNTSYRLLAESEEIFKDVVSQINEEPNVDFVMFTGDQVNTPYEKELIAFLKIANQINYPWYAALGNHDVCIGGYLTKALYVNILNSHNKNFSFEKPYYTFTPKKGYKIIVLDSIIDTRITSNGEIGDEQLNWLDNEMSKATKNDVILIFMHVPLVEPLPSPSHRLLDADKMSNVLQKYKNPIGVFTGHYHTTKITKHGNILYVSTPSLISYPNAFRIVNVNAQKDKVLFDIYFKETRYKDVQKRAKLMVFASKAYYGAENDRTATYEIKR